MVYDRVIVKRTFTAAAILASSVLLAALPEDDLRETRVAEGVYPADGVDKVVLANASLDDWEVVSAGLFVGANGTPRTTYPSFASREDGVYEVQIVGTYDFYKGVKLQFRQSGSDIVCRAVYARYSELNKKLGVNLDYFDKWRYSVIVASAADKDNYGIASITFRKRTGIATTTYSADTPLAGPFVANAPVVIEPTATFGDAGRMPAEVQLTDRLDFISNGGTETTLTNRLSGLGGTVSFKTVADSYQETTNSFGSYASDATQIWSTKTLILSGKRLSDIVSFEDVRVSKGVATPYHFRSAGEERMTVQMQREATSYIYCAFVVLTEDSSGVWAQQTKNYYCFKSHGSHVVLGMDLEANNDGAYGNYPLMAVKVVTRVPRSTVTLSGATTSYGGAFNVGTNVEVITLADTVLPTGGVVTVENGGTLRLKAGAQNNSRFRVKDGGTLIHDRKAGNVFGNRSHVDVEGGTLWFANGTGSSTGGSISEDANSYLNSVTVSDGGVVKGSFWPRVGNIGPYSGYNDGYQSARWRFTGSSPSYLKSGILFVGVTRHTLYIEVDDVTGDAGVDMYQTGELRDYTSNDSGRKSSDQYGHVRKVGAGTWHLNANCYNLFGDLYLDVGTLVMARSQMFSKLAKYYYTTTGAIKFNGGTLATEANVTNTLLGVQVLANSKISVPEGGHIDITACTNIAWTAGKTLSIECAEPKAVRFGTSADALTPVQQRALRLNGRRCHLNDEGYPETHGCLLIIR